MLSVTLDSAHAHQITVLTLHSLPQKVIIITIAKASILIDSLEERGLFQPGLIIFQLLLNLLSLGRLGRALRRQVGAGRR